MTSQDKNSPLQQLWDQRILQFTFSYIIGAFAVVQLIDWLSNRYNFSPVWTDVVFVFLAALVPSVLLFTYFHGQGNLDQLNPTVKKFVPANMVLAICLTFFLFKGSQLGATSSKVTVVTEDGEEIERLVPKSSQSKRLLLFPLEDVNFNADQGANWLASYFSVLQDADLGQDNRLFSFNTYDLQYEYEQNGYEFGQQVPLSVYLKIAKDYLTDFFMTGTFKQENDQYMVEIAFYSTNDGKEFFKKSYQEADYFNIIDQISEDFRQALYLREADGSGERIADLPASNLYSPNLKALKHYFDGRQLFDDNKREKGIAEVEQAVQLDPNFAEAYKMLGIQQYRNQQSEQGEKSLGKAISLSNTIGLPERQKFDMRYYYYAKNDQAKKTLNLLKMWNQLYPNDYIPYYRLYSIYSNRKEYKVAEEFVIKAIDNGHIARSLPRMATLCALQGRYEEALEYLQRFEQEYPHKAKINTSMGRLYQRMGKLDKALEYFEAIQLLQPNDPYAIGNVAYVQTNLGNIDEAEKLYLEALSKAKLPQDSSSVTQWMLYFYGTIGQLENYEKYLWMTINTRSTFRPPAEAYSILAWYDHIIFYVQHGEQKRYRRFLDDYNNRFTRGNDNMACVNKLTFAMATLNLEESKLYGDQCIDFFGEVAGKHYVYLFDALVADMEKDYPEMIAKFEAFIDATGSKEQFWASQLARAHRQNGDFQKAYDIIKQSLMLSPNSPELCYEMARICLAMEKNEEAVKYLQTANKIWRKADPRFKPAQEVREKLAELAG